MRLLISGGRKRNDKDFIFKTLDEIHAERTISALIEGGATGVDAIGYLWAVMRSVKPIKVKADWTRYGYAAGPIRNQKMLDDEKPDMLLAAPGIGSVGTYDMIERAKTAGIEIRII